jgi:flagellar biosynthesis protein FlhF
MQLQTFIADSALEAVRQIRERLGPEAVVVNVRQVSNAGLSRLWSKPRVEVLAYKPEEPGSTVSDSLTQLRQELAAIKDQIESRPLSTPPEPQLSPGASVRPDAEAYAPGRRIISREPTPPRAAPVFGAESINLHTESAFETVSQRTAGRWRIGALLESTGLLPLPAQQIVETLRLRHGEAPPQSMGQELQLASAVLLEAWRRPPPATVPGTHVFIGAPGVGKTTCICQWLTRATLVEGTPSRVWRLDGRSANNAESLSVYAEILGIPVERQIPQELPPPGEMLFVDLPGVNWIDPYAVQPLARHLDVLPNPVVHLVLNAAYETPTLLAQARAFEICPVADLILTHLDEEHRWGKLWNLIFGTKYTIAWLNAGQNIPGDFQPASPEQILARQFLRK